MIRQIDICGDDGMTVSFADVLDIKNGRNQKEVENPNGAYPIYGSGGVMGRANDYICPANTVVIGRKGSINKPVFVREPFWNVDTAFGLVANESLLLPRYLYYFCIYYDFEKLNTTVTIPSLTKANLLKISLNLPTIGEQKRVVEILSQIEEVIQKRRQQLSALDDLIKARFVEMFGDETNPYQLPVVNVEDVANVSVGVVIKPAQYYTDAEHGVKAFRSLNIGAGTIKDSDWVYFSHEGNDKNSKSQLRENDLLIVRSGAPGTACVVPKEFEGCNAIDIIIARPKTDKVNPHYLCTYTNLPHGKRQIDEGTGGAAQQHFNVGKYNKLQLMLPTLKQQNEFVSFLKQIDKSKSVIQKSLDETQLLFDRLMQQYYG